MLALLGLSSARSRKTLFARNKTLRACKIRNYCWEVQSYLYKMVVCKSGKTHTEDTKPLFINAVYIRIYSIHKIQDPEFRPGALSRQLTCLSSFLWASLYKHSPGKVWHKGKKAEIITLSLAGGSGVFNMVEFLSTFDKEASDSNREVVNQNLWSPWSFWKEHRHIQRY